MTFDRFSGERERKCLDFLLGFSVTKRSVALSKIAGATQNPEGLWLGAVVFDRRWLDTFETNPSGGHLVIILY